MNDEDRPELGSLGAAYYSRYRGESEVERLKRLIPVMEDWAQHPDGSAWRTKVERMKLELRGAEIFKTEKGLSGRPARL